MNFLGVMQGRLLPKYKNRYQSHPVGYWQDEFIIAKEFGLNLIEFIVDYEDVEKNPLLSNEGIEEISSLSKKNEVMVRTLCADFFMEAPLHSEDLYQRQKSKDILKRLSLSCKHLGITEIVIPCVDHSSFQNKNQISIFKDVLNDVIGDSPVEVNFSLETDLGPKDFADLVDYFDNSRVGVNYDIGNSASLGFNCSEEIEAYGHYINDVHIKDRRYKSDSVFLGDGDADFHMVFEKLSKIGYKGPFIMQAYRDMEGKNVFKSQLDWILPILQTYFVLA
tara:strand:- start:5618 stop:6451 length:834 start_codon:yes stop_codon:yes gene_type:complete